MSIAGLTGGWLHRSPTERCLTRSWGLGCRVHKGLHSADISKTLLKSGPRSAERGKRARQVARRGRLTWHGAETQGSQGAQEPWRACWILAGRCLGAKAGEKSKKPRRCLCRYLLGP